MNTSAAVTRMCAVAAVGVAAAALAGAPVAAEPSAELTVFAGTGVAGSAGDGGPASGAQLHDPRGIAVAGNGTVYISDAFNHTVRAVAPDGTIRTVAGTGNLPPTAALRDDAEATRFDLGTPADLAVGPDGSLYIADTGLFRILRLGGDGRIRTVAGTGVAGFAGDGGPATAARIGMPVGLAVADDGTLYFGDPENQRLRRVAPDGTVDTVAGDGRTRLEAAGGPATGVAVPGVLGLGRDGAGNVWIVDASYLHQLRGGRLVTVTEPVGELAGQRWSTSGAATWPKSPLANVRAVAADGASVYALTVSGLLRLGVDHRLETIGGLGDATRFGPIAASAGAVYLVDGNGNRVYVIHPAPPRAQPQPGAPRPTPWWPWVVGGAVAVLLIAIVTVPLRRRAAR